MSPIDIDQWILVKLVPAAHGKTTKIPVNHRTLRNHDAHDPAIWLPHATARAMATMLGPEYGIGFDITETDPYVCVDIDSCLQPDGTWSPEALAMCSELPGAMIEVSQSGKGLHIWCAFQGPVPLHGSRGPNKTECYSRLRFILWGSQQTGSIVPHCEALPAFLAKHFPYTEVAPGAILPGNGPRSDWRGPIDDAELIRRAMQSRSVAAKFGDDRAAFADLWTANWPVLAKSYPGDDENGCDRSRVDSALASHLCFWSGCDAERVERLLRQSALVRDKWDLRPDYLRGHSWSVVDHACSVQTDVLQDKPVEIPAIVPAAPAPAAPIPAPPAEPGPSSAALPAPTPSATAAAMTLRAGETFIDAAGQMELFRGHVYIIDQHKVLCPGGRLVKPEQFRAMFGGRSFVMDTRNDKVSRNAFEALTESQVVAAPMAHNVFFDPKQPPAALVTHAGLTLANTWWPVQTPRMKGDATPFLNHVRLLCPLDFPQAMAFMAFCVQYPGVKAQWALLLQGVEGNGKTFLSRCLAEALSERYTHWPKASQLNSRFNSWMLGKLLYCCEDVFTTEDVDVFEQLKPMITGDRLEIEGKGQDQFSAGVCGNFMLNTNFIVGGLRKTANDRRLCVIHTAQQQASDLARDGMDEKYMAKLYHWAKRQGGYAIVTDLLHTWKIPDELNPAVHAQRAPRTSSTDAAVEASMGFVEQSVLQAAEDDEVGFRGGWVSSMALERLLDRIRMSRAMPPNRRRAMLGTLGYAPHPALTGSDGRVNGVIPPDNGKPRLYLQKSHPDLALKTNAEVVAAYCRAQGLK